MPIGLLFEGYGARYAQLGEMLYRWLVQSKDIAKDFVRMLTEIGRVTADVQLSTIETVRPPLHDLAVSAPYERLPRELPLSDQRGTVAYGCSSQTRGREHIGRVGGWMGSAPRCHTIT